MPHASTCRFARPGRHLARACLPPVAVRCSSSSREGGTTVTRCREALLGSLVDLAQQLACARDPDRPIGDQVAPHPIVVTDDRPSIEMRPVAERVTVSDSTTLYPFETADLTVASTQKSVAHPETRSRSGAIFSNVALNSVPANGSFSVFRATKSAWWRCSSGRNSQPGVCGSKSSPTRPQCLTKITVPERERTLAVRRLMRSTTPCKSYLGAPLRSPTCISTTTIASMSCPLRRGTLHED